MYLFTMKKLLIVIAAAAVVVPGVLIGSAPESSSVAEYQFEQQEVPTVSDNVEEIVLGGGCFWCIEAVYERINGIVSAVSGYAGGDVPNPTYQQVTSGRTGHAEVVKIGFDPDIISLEKVLEVFWAAHDPTTVDRQGADVGPQYRSIILYANDQQRDTAQASMDQLTASGDLGNRSIVTQLVPLDVFYPAEDYHQDYFDKNPSGGYCQVVIAPKLRKLGLNDFARRLD